MESLEPNLTGALDLLGKERNTLTFSRSASLAVYKQSGGYSGGPSKIGLLCHFGHDRSEHLKVKSLAHFGVAGI